VSELDHFEYPPPRSWEQFEDLCADLFEAMWSDPGLVRHGRAGQVQFGVDIVAARGGVYPVGLQCKKKSRWPVKKLTVKEIDDEVEAAEKFRPTLQELYILTTAVSDGALQEHVRTLNESRGRQKKFPVAVLFWPELVRRIARFDHVAQKHFPIGSGADEFSPLLATWYTKGGKLELTDVDWHLAVREVGEDFHDWPTGRVVVRQRETDAKVAQLRKLENEPVSSQRRKAKLELRAELRYMRERERKVQDTIRMLYTNEQLKFYMLYLDETGVDARNILQAIIESRLQLNWGSNLPQKIKLLPPSPHRLIGPRSPSSVAGDDILVPLPSSGYAEILQKERDFPKRFYGNAIVKIVSELPPSVRARLAIPAIVGRIERIMREDRKSLVEMEIAGYLNLNDWKYQH